MSRFESIAFEQADGVVHIRISRSEAANALDEQLARELAEAALICDSDPAIRCVLLTAQGRYFCAGGDVRAMATAGQSRNLVVKNLADQIHRAISSFARMQAPLVVAVNGPAAGAGFGLAMCGDLVLASESARFTMAYTTVGLNPDAGATFYLPRMIGLRRTQELAFTNRTLGAREALDWGLITQVVSDADLEEHARALARRLADGPRGAHANIKTLLANTYTSGLESQMEIERRSIGTQSNSAEAQEGLEAFLSKRAANFRKAN